MVGGRRAAPKGTAGVGICTWRSWASASTFALLALTSAPGEASDGESFLRVGGGYAMTSTASERHGGLAELGFGYAVSDFSQVDVGVSWAAYPPGDTWLGTGTGTGAFRLLIDATEWVPSIGVAVGWMAFASEEDGFDPGTMLFGPQGCLEYRAQRDRSVLACVFAGSFPLENDPDAYLAATIDFAAYLPYFFE